MVDVKIFGDQGLLPGRPDTHAYMARRVAERRHKVDLRAHLMVGLHQVDQARFPDRAHAVVERRAGEVGAAVCGLGLLLGAPIVELRARQEVAGVREGRDSIGCPPAWCSSPRGPRAGGCRAPRRCFRAGSRRRPGRPGNSSADRSRWGCRAACRCRCRCRPRCAQVGVSTTRAWMLIFSLPFSSAKWRRASRISHPTSGVACGRINRVPPVALQLQETRHPHIPDPPTQHPWFLLRPALGASSKRPPRKTRRNRARKRI